MDKIIILIGFMGSGKSYLGKKAADFFQTEFLDLDLVIEKQQSLSISQIFEKFGEEYFRKLENEMLRKIKIGSIIATGGGIVEQKINRVFFQTQDKYVIWLNPSWETILSRIKNTERPLVSKLTENELLDLWQSRKPFYRECADCIIKNPNLKNLIKAIQSR